MSDNAISKSLKGMLKSLLAGKPMWAFWIAYSVVAGLLFGLFYLAIYLLALRWWLAALVILAIGVIWGSIAYMRDSPKREEQAGTKKGEA